MSCLKKWLSCLLKRWKSSLVSGEVFSGLAYQSETCSTASLLRSSTGVPAQKSTRGWLELAVSFTSTTHSNLNYKQIHNLNYRLHRRLRGVLSETSSTAELLRSSIEKLEDDWNSQFRFTSAVHSYPGKHEETQNNTVVSEGSSGLAYQSETSSTTELLNAGHRCAGPEKHSRMIGTPRFSLFLRNVIVFSRMKKLNKKGFTLVQLLKTRFVLDEHVKCPSVRLNLLVNLI